MPDYSQIAGYMATAGNSILQGATNAANRNFTREMYMRQRQDALSDWDKQNLYNSPREQMQRFQEAGLNDNLIYGNMANSPTVRSSEAPAGTAKAPQIDMAAIMDLKRTSAQADLLQQQHKLQAEDIQLRKAQTYLTIVKSDLTEVQKKQALLDLGIQSELRETTIEGKKADLELTRQRTKESQDNLTMLWEKHPEQFKAVMLENLNRAQQNAKSVKEIQHIQAQIQLLNREWEIMAIDEKLAKGGINWKDPFWSRWAQNLRKKLDNASSDPYWKEKFKDYTPIPKNTKPWEKFIPKK